jgi:hypothetical protein
MIFLMVVVKEKSFEEALLVKQFLVELMKDQQQTVQVEYHFH